MHLPKTNSRQKNSLDTTLAIVFIMTPTPKTIKAPIKEFHSQFWAFVILVVSAPALIYIMPLKIIAIIAIKTAILVKKEPTMAIKLPISAKVKPLGPKTGVVGIIIWAISNNLVINY